MSDSSNRKNPAVASPLPDWEAVERVKARELAAMTDERAWGIIMRLRAFGPVEPNPENGFGLIKQQAIFHGKT